MHRQFFLRLFAAAFLVLLVLLLVPETARSAVVIAAALAIVALRRPRVRGWVRSHSHRASDR